MGSKGFAEGAGTIGAGKRAPSRYNDGGAKGCSGDARGRQMVFVYRQQMSRRRWNKVETADCRPGLRLDDLLIVAVTDPFDVDQGNNIKGTTYSVSTNKESAITGKLVNNKLTATAVDGTKIDGDLDDETLILSGVWSNVSALQAGTYTGGGCRLN